MIWRIIRPVPCPEVRHLPHRIIPQHARHAENVHADDRQWGSPSHFELIRMANETDSKPKTSKIVKSSFHLSEWQLNEKT